MLNNEVLVQQFVLAALLLQCLYGASLASPPLLCWGDDFHLLLASALALATFISD
jgi:hypothetical protein